MHRLRWRIQFVDHLKRASQGPADGTGNTTVLFHILQTNICTTFKSNDLRTVYQTERFNGSKQVWKGKAGQPRDIVFAQRTGTISPVTKDRSFWRQQQVTPNLPEMIHQPTLVHFVRRPSPTSKQAWHQTESHAQSTISSLIFAATETVGIVEIVHYFTIM